MKNGITRIVMFSMGAFGYGLIEILWRGYTHWTMFIAGGISLCGLSAISEKFEGAKRLGKAILGGIFITAVEFITGVIFNTRKNIWDYSRLPLNIGGQICAFYSAAWVLLSFFALPLIWKLNKKLK